MDAMYIWNQVQTPPQSALKKIKGGRLSGMSDINPQWRYGAMTSIFGPVGIGWAYTIDKQWLEPGADNQVVAFVNITLKIKDGDEWSEGIPGTGGSMFIAKEKNGMHTSDEAYKMALTDALSVAMKQLGVAADVYMGRCDTKYRDAESKQQEPQKSDAVVTIESIEEEKGNTNGRDWVQYIIMADGEKHRTFDAGIASVISDCISNKVQVKINYETNKYGRNIVSVEPQNDVDI